MPALMAIETGNFRFMLAARRLDLTDDRRMALDAIAVAKYGDGLLGNLGYGSGRLLGSPGRASPESHKPHGQKNGRGQDK